MIFYVKSYILGIRTNKNEDYKRVKWVGSHTARQNKNKEGLPNSDSKVHALRSFQFLLDKPSLFCPLRLRLFDGNNQCVGANSVAKGGQRVITGTFCGFYTLKIKGI